MVDLQHTGRQAETAIWNEDAMDDAGIQPPGVQFEVTENRRHPIARDVPEDVADWLQEQDDEIEEAPDVDAEADADRQAESDADVDVETPAEPEPELDADGDPEREDVPIAADNDADGTQPRETPSDEQRAENAVVGGSDADTEGDTEADAEDDRPDK